MFNITLSFTQQQLQDIIANAQSLYWLDDGRYDFTNGVLKIIAPGDNWDPIIQGTIGPQQIADALQGLPSSITYPPNPQGNGRVAAHIFKQLLDGYPDGATCDDILQLAVFGKVVFG